MLIMASDNPNQIAGVIAHETGHIAGGHLSRIGSAVEPSMRPTRSVGDSACCMASSTT